ECGPDSGRSSREKCELRRSDGGQGKTDRARQRARSRPPSVLDSRPGGLPTRGSGSPGSKGLLAPARFLASGSGGGESTKVLSVHERNLSFVTGGQVEIRGANGENRSVDKNEGES